LLPMAAPRTNHQCPYKGYNHWWQWLCHVVITRLRLPRAARSQWHVQR